jgi:hypothetical protein
MIQKRVVQQLLNIKTRLRVTKLLSIISNVRFVYFFLFVRFFSRYKIYIVNLVYFSINAKIRKRNNSLTLEIANEFT